MKKLHIKIFVVTISFLLTATLIVTASFAWFTISSNPVVEGISITISGNSAIQIAANITETIDDETYNYPADFTDDLNIGNYESYDYLEDLAGLYPVSTSDGEHWYYATYYEPTNEEVINGSVITGSIKDITEFDMDDSLSLANLTNKEIDDETTGHYVYLDFWVVSPIDYDLRISTNTDSGENDGSYLIDLLVPQEVDSDDDGEMDSYTLVEADESVASSARIGFLTSSVTATDEDLTAYINSEYYNEEYTSLIGQYQDEGDVASYIYQNNFVIYEPNGDLHTNSDIDGDYVITYPIGLVNGEADLINVQSILSVQLNNTWTKVNDNYEIENPFLASIIDYDFGETTISQLFENFYNTYLQSQVSNYVNKGNFIADTTQLYDLAVNDVVDEASIKSVEQSGATETTYIVSLQKNIPQRIRMFIWIEGQDIDCSSQSSATSFALGIEFAGSNE